MSEAHARCLTDDSFDAPPAPALRLLTSEAGQADVPASAPRAPGRPHPRSRIRPAEQTSSAVLDRNEARVAAAAAPRTIVVTGQRTPAARVEGPARRMAGADRSPTLASVGARPDRLALWAVGLGLLMAFMAAATAEAASPAPAPPAAAPLAVTR